MKRSFVDYIFNEQPPQTLNEPSPVEHYTRTSPIPFSLGMDNQMNQMSDEVTEAISESLGLDKDRIKNVLGEQGQHMAINYYLACPEPELTYGLPAHIDSNALTILLQDLQVAGLQALKDGKWLAIKPHPGAFVVNIGDQLQVNSCYVVL
ncbi:hypothetical protein BUALT_Bualt01G0212400 [Buddleja alternifolia]|uniref:Fe2OG dioxygenase domain-containing protein n=1 Tax=Buddleja alternifolia TaxID=168488 RepID=A0AAV6YA04_9LAMI|nr:hypothetical protein BUALT_Bualt01G0212400 [Buddleja alternifolia]